MHLTTKDLLATRIVVTFGILLSVFGFLQLAHSWGYGLLESLGAALLGGVVAAEIAARMLGPWSLAGTPPATSALAAFTALGPPTGMPSPNAAVGNEVPVQAAIAAPGQAQPSTTAQP
jgi:hypothetical protein